MKCLSDAVMTRVNGCNSRMGVAKSANIAAMVIWWHKWFWAQYAAVADAVHHSLPVFVHRRFVCLCL